MKDQFFVTGNHGIVTADSNTGRVISYEPSPEGTNEYSNIARFDVEEWNEHYPNEELDGMIVDVLDIGFWEDTGFYVEAEAEWREEFITHKEEMA